MSQIRFGILGAGAIANRFAKVCAPIEQVKIQAVASSDQTRGREFAAHHGIESTYTSYPAMLADPAIDCVYIALTHQNRPEILNLCLAAGKPVLCEKPMFLHGPEARSIIEAYRQQGLLLMEALWSRCIPTFITARQWIATGRIGKPALVQAAFSFYCPCSMDNRLFNPSLAGGSLYDVGVYPLSCAMGLLGEVPLRIAATGTRASTGVDDAVAMSVQFASGALASLSCGFTTNSSNDAWVYGSSGKLVVRDFLGSHQVALYDNNDQLIEKCEEAFEDGFYYQITHFCDLLRTKAVESPLVPHHHTIACAEAFDTILSQI